MSKELKPCPFCGGDASFDHDDNGWNWIHCKSCDATTSARVSAMDDCKPLLAEAWNRRAPAEPVKMTLNEAKQLIGLPETPHRLSLGDGLAVMGSAESIAAVKRPTESVKVPSDEEVLKIAIDSGLASRDSTGDVVCAWREDADISEYLVENARALLAKHSERPSKCSEATTYHPEDIADTAAQAFRDGLNAALEAAQDARDSLPIPQYHGASRCVAAIKELIESAKK